MKRSRDSVVGIATRYGLEGPGIEPQWGEIFHIHPDRLRDPPSLLYSGYRVFPGGKGGRGVMLTTHPLLVPTLRKSWTIPPLALWVLLGLLRGFLYLYSFLYETGLLLGLLLLINVSVLGAMLCDVTDMKLFDTKDDCSSYQPNVVNRLLQVSHPRMLPILDSLPRELHKSPPTSLDSAVTPTQENYVSVRSDIVTSHNHVIFSF
jgi:hypothetical protein